MVKGPHQKGHLPLGGGSLKYVIPNIDIWALIDPPKRKIHPGPFSPSKVEKTCWKIPSTSGMRSRKQAPMKTPPEKQDNKDISVSHLRFFYNCTLFIFIFAVFCIHIWPTRIITKGRVPIIKMEI